MVVLADPDTATEEGGPDDIQRSPKKEVGREDELDEIHGEDQENLKNGDLSGTPTGEDDSGKGHFTESDQGSEDGGCGRAEDAFYDGFVPGHEIEDLAEKTVDEPNGCDEDERERWLHGFDVSHCD